ncbi:MAG: hydrolase [bacterium]|nr:hydrolase [bacterium]
MLEKENAVLTVIDVQGKLAALMQKHESLFTNVNRMIKAANVLDIPIVWTEQIPDKLGETVPEIKKNLDPDSLLTKTTFSCCGGPGFNERLQELGRNQVLVTGIEAHVCVYQTSLDLLKNGYEVHLVKDAVSSRIKSNYRLGVERIKEAGATMTSVEMSLFEMLKVAQGDEFKEIIRIVK